jgi:hypothetical protein
MQPMQPTDPVTLTLTADQWNVVLAQLQEGPMRIVRPVFDAMLQQIQELQQDSAAPPIEQPRPNGEAAHAPG